MSDPGEIIAAAYAKEKRIRDLRANPRENRKEIEQLVARLVVYFSLTLRARCAAGLRWLRTLITTLATPDGLVLPLI